MDSSSVTFFPSLFPSCSAEEFRPALRGMWTSLDLPFLRFNFSAGVALPMRDQLLGTSSLPYSRPLHPTQKDVLQTVPITMIRDFIPLPPFPIFFFFLKFRRLEKAIRMKLLNTGFHPLFLPSSSTAFLSFIIGTVTPVRLALPAVFSLFFLFSPPSPRIFELFGGF